MIWIKQLVSAVAFLHQNKIVHRDIKLENCFINDKNDLFLGDFGIAKSESLITG